MKFLESKDFLAALDEEIKEKLQEANILQEDVDYLLKIKIGILHVHAQLLKKELLEHEIKDIIDDKKDGN